MERIKSIFISLYIASNAALLLYAVFMLFAHGYQWFYGTMLLSAGSVCGYFALLYLTKSLPRVDNSAIFKLLGLVWGGIITSWYGLKELEQGSIAEGLLMVVFSGFGTIAYGFWYSKLPHTAVKTGQPFPLDLQLKDTDGRAVDLTVFSGKPVLFLFYRGNWCPLCVAQIKELAQSYQQFGDAGIDVVLVSPQPQKQTAELAKKFQVPLQFLVDDNLDLARKLGIVHTNGLPLGLQLLGYRSDVVLPVAIYKDENDVIALMFQTDNYRLRPEPEFMLGKIQELKNQSMT